MDWEQHSVSFSRLTLSTTKMCECACVRASGRLWLRRSEKSKWWDHGNKKHVQNATCYGKANNDFYRNLERGEVNTFWLIY